MKQLEGLLEQVKADFPEFSYQLADFSYFDPQTKVIFHQQTFPDPNFWHELGHATLDHQEFTSDLDLLRKERAAWTKAKELAAQYRQTISDNDIEDALDKYRDWRHQRSLCPECGQNGIQNPRDLTYRCPACHTGWKVNASPQKRLRKQKITPVVG
jgi:hypothetical protein